MPIRRSRPRWTRWIVGVAVACLAYVLVMTPVLVFPRTDNVTHVDVVLVLGPAVPWRMDQARELADQGVTQNVLVSVPGSRDTWPEECRQPDQAGFTVVCFRPDPFTTQGEARELRAQMQAHGWTTAAAITMTPHVARARMIIDRCVPGGVQMIGGGHRSPAEWAYNYVYQGAGFVKAFLVTTGC